MDERKLLIKKILWIAVNVIFLGIPFGFMQINKKIRLTITTKTTLLFLLIFGIILLVVVVFVISSIETYFSKGVFTDEANQAFLKQMRISVGILVPLFLIVALSLGLSASSSMLSPIRKMTDKLNEFEPKDLSLRLEPIDSQDELRVLTDIVNTMLERLDAAFKQQAEFVSNASHELRTPIAVIQGYISLLDRWGKENPEILLEAISAISNESQNMKTMVEKLLFLTKLGNRYQLNKTSFLINELLEEIAKETSIIDKKHKIIIEKSEIIEIYADFDLIKQALRILVDNSIKYSPENAEIRMRAYQVESADGSEVFAGISVRDFGNGISEEDLPHIFDRFYRCDKARGRAEGSTGLGLSIARQIVELHQGTITAKSELNVGSEFRIEIQN